MAQRLEPTTERALVMQAQRDPAAFHELYRHYLPRVYGYIAARLPERSEAEDVTAATFLKALERLNQFRDRGDGAFAAWLFRIAHHSVIDYQRRLWFRRAPLTLDRALAVVDPAEPLDVLLTRAEVGAQVRQAVATLSPRRQEVIALRFFAGLRNVEIAAVLGIAERSVAAHLCRALDDLRALLGTSMPFAVENQP